MILRAACGLAIACVAVVPAVQGGNDFVLTSCNHNISLVTHTSSGYSLLVAAKELPSAGSNDAAPLARQRNPADGFIWEPSLSTGYDTYIQTYALSLSDTTETISDFDLTLAAEGRSSGKPRHGWLIRPQLSAGSERHRARCEWGYTYKPDRRLTTFRFDGDLRATWYDPRSDYYLTSDSVEGDLNGRWIVSPQGALAAELKGWASLTRYATPSELEADRHDLNVAAYLKSGRDATRRWRAGFRTGARAYPDSSEIDRDSAGFELEYDHNAFFSPTARVYHRTERRKIANPAFRPSSWSHWTRVETSLPLNEADLRLIGDLAHEAWVYDVEWGAYTDQTRWEADLALTGGGVFGPAWRVGAAYESLASGSEGESYAQQGVRGGLDHFADGFSGSLTLEIGKRDYDETETVVGAGGVEEFSLYTDFTYVEVWLMAGVEVTEDLRLDVMGSYMPENHTEEMDDQKLGFGTARLVYRF